MSAKRPKEKSLLSRQEIASRRRALSSKKLAAPGVGRRAIWGVVLLAVSALAFFSIATFDAHDRIGPGFHNAIGPVGHALAEALRGLLGVCAFALPLAGFYAAALVITGEKDKQRWPQFVAFALLLLSTSVLAQLALREDASWAHAPGGLVGRELSGILTALFSTVGTVVLVSAVAAVAFIVGTELQFLRLCGFVWEKAVELGGWLSRWTETFVARQKEQLEARMSAREKERVEEAAFLAQLEAEEAHLDGLEAAAFEADYIAEEAARAQREKDALRAQEIEQKERERAAKERDILEKEAARLAREALKTARAMEKENRQGAASSIAQGLLAEAAVPPPGQGAAIGSVASTDPAWAAFFAGGSQKLVSFPPQPAAAASSAQGPATAQGPARRLPNIIEPPAPPKEAFASLPPTPAAELAQASGATAAESVGALSIAASESALAPVAAAATGAQLPTAALATGVGATALARMPVIVEPKAPPKPTKRPQFEMAAGRTGFDLPPLDVLEAKQRERAALDKDAFLSTAEKLTSKLKDFGIEGEVVEIRPGPVVTMYEFKPAAGVKISRIASLSDDLAMAMEAMRVRIVAPIPGKGVVGIEVPNKDRETVFLKEIAEQEIFLKSKSTLTMCLGKDIEGMPYLLDLAKAPHLLMAGTTGSGKSVSVNSMIMSLILKATPEEVRFIMVDPKMLELSVYEGIPHLLLPVVTDPRKAAIALQWAVEEMTRRYKLLAEAGVRNIAGYNAKIEEEQKKKASDSTIEAKPKSIKPQEEKKVAAPPTPAPAAETKADAAPPSPPRKKRRLLIVDVAGEGEGAPQPAEAEAAGGPANALSMGVPAPTEDEPENPLEAAAAESPVEAEVEAALTEAEIRVNEAQGVEPTEEETAALAAAAATSAPADETEEKKKLPYIVVIIDELADLMMVAAKEVETSIARLAQMARAAGIHLMVATQRPSTDVVTGLIKANFPTRISFMLRTKIDSMTILGATGSEALLGMGDMLILPPTSAHLQRVHGCFVSETEIKRTVDHLKAQGKPVYDENILKPRDEEGEGEGGEGDAPVDEMYDQAIAVVSEMKTVSISMLQRKMRLGYNRAARIIERMERDGLVGPADGAKPREVYARPLGEMPGAGAM